MSAMLLRRIFVLSAALAACFAQDKPNPLAPIADQMGLPRVLLIGDSISIGYTLPVRKLLAGKANVHRIAVNAGPTSRGIANIDSWLATPAGLKWDVIHFNFGLHDLRIMDHGKQQVPPEEYEKNLRVIAAKLKATGAKLIWATTTPFPDTGLTPPRRVADLTQYNAIASGVMKELKIPMNDLYSFALPRLAEIQRPANVHFFDAGSEALAGQVAAAIERALR